MLLATRRMQIKTTMKYHHTCIRMRKTSLNKFKKIQIIQSISSDLNGIKLEINNIRYLENPQIFDN